ncbi:MAG: DNA methyltransferase [Chthoniobacterales bacterium]
MVRPWRDRIAAAGKNVGQLRSALADLRKFRVLDPACGSGNFLFIAYREMKRLERDLLLRLREVSRKEPLESAISLNQFYGLDILPFAVELAKVTLMLAKELELEEAKKLAETDQLLIEEKPLPLDNLDKNIICADALFIEWPKADAIIGNPPYLDARKMNLEHGADYVKRLRKAFPGVPGRADFVTYFFRKAHDQLARDGRAGLVGTNTIRQNYSRQGGLDYIVRNGGTIADAVSTEVWSGQAAVHVSIVNWIKGEEKEVKRLTIQRGDRIDSPWESYELPQINSALSPGFDVASAESLKTNSNSTACFEGQQPGHNGFRLNFVEAQTLAKAGSAEVIFPYLNGDELLSGALETEPRFIIDFGERDIFAAQRFAAALEFVRERVLPD